MSEKMSERTIAAVATPPGEGSVGVIRISGEKAVEIADSVFFAVSGKPLSALKGWDAPDDFDINDEEE